MMIAPSQDDRTEEQDTPGAEGDEKRVLSPDEAMTVPRGKAGRTHGFGAAKGKCELGAGAERY